MTPPALALTLNRFTSIFDGDLAAVVDAAGRAEDAGVDSVVMTDHVLIGPRTDLYPFGTFSFPPDESWPEPLIMLAAIASRTERVRLATSVLVTPARPAALLAKTVATVDALSHGRIQLGLGTGWQREEVEVCGVPMQGRTARMEDTIGACRALWAGGATTYSSPTVSFTDLWCVPTPHQERVPIWLAGPPTEAVARRVASLGDGWIPLQIDIDAIAAGAQLMRDAATKIGRDPNSIGVRASLTRVAGSDGNPHLASTLESGYHQLVGAGCTEIGVSLGAFVREKSGITPFLDELSRRWQALAD